MIESRIAALKGNGRAVAIATGLLVAAALALGMVLGGGSAALGYGSGGGGGGGGGTGNSLKVSGSSKIGVAPGATVTVSGRTKALKAADIASAPKVKLKSPAFAKGTVTAKVKSHKFSVKAKIKNPLTAGTYTITGFAKGKQFAKTTVKVS